MAIDVGMWNILVMGFAFMFIFTAFQTTSMIEVSVVVPFLQIIALVISKVLSNFAVYNNNVSLSMAWNNRLDPESSK